MRFCEFRKKEVISIKDCKRLGHVCDMEFDECKGCIQNIDGSRMQGIMGIPDRRFSDCDSLLLYSPDRPGYHFSRHIISHIC